MQTASYTYVTYINTTPEKLWNALIDPEMTKLYWGNARKISDWKEGSQWTHQDYDDESLVDLVGTVLESKPPSRLVLTWKQVGADKPGKTSRVAFEIAPMMDTVKLTVIHDELDEELQKLISQGWPAVLSSLKTLLETGDAMGMTKRRWCK